jgi:hypothetical protein
VAKPERIELATLVAKSKADIVEKPAK